MQDEPQIAGNDDVNPTDVPVQAELVEKPPIPTPTGSPFKSSVSSKIDRTQNQSPVTWREKTAILLLIVICDLTIYRGHGFAGLALLFFLAPALLFFGSFRPVLGRATCIVGVMTAALAAKTLWCGSELSAITGFVLLAAFASCIAGQIPYILEVMLHATNSIRAGYDGLVFYCKGVRIPGARLPWVNVLLPLVAFVVFGMIFILANPDLVTSFSETSQRILTELRDWLVNFSFFEIMFWIAVLWISVGLLRPDLLQSGGESSKLDSTKRETVQAPAPLYAAFRNTLVTVIVLFAIYLVFEFRTLWFREFPKGFYYSGYAHEGAAWLTCALALATVFLSLIFRGTIVSDPRLSQLRTLAWIWSVQNFILAIAVFNRMFIYIDFNGMTRMRTVGLFGITTVVVGFIFVLWNINANRDFIWLLRRHLWTLAVAIYIFALTPVDAIVVNYNVRRILAGDPAPSVEISVHPINAEGVLLLQLLLNCDDEIIREGVRAMLSQRDDEFESLDKQRQDLGWTTFQIADRMVLEALRANRQQWAEYTNDSTKRKTALDRFHEYAYQWY